MVRAASVTLTALLLASACKFEPRLAAGKLVCTDDLGCPQDYVCRASGQNPSSKACCPVDECGSSGDGGSRLSDAADGRPRDGAGPDRPPANNDAKPAVDGGAEASVPPMLSPSDARPETGSDALDGGSLPPVMCTRNFETPVVPAAGEKLGCTIALRDTFSMVAIDVLPNNDPVAMRTAGLCWAEPPLGSETTEAKSGLPRPLSVGTLETLVALTAHFRKLCAQHNAPLVGVEAGRWARQATNQGELRARFAERTGLELDIPTPEQELVRTYLGVTRQRRGRIMVDNAASIAEFVVWRAPELAPVRHVLPVSYRAAGNLYFSNSAFTSLEQARLQLRARVLTEMRSVLASLAAGIADGSLASTVSVGPGTATLPLALAGKLRNPEGLWVTPVDHKMKLAAATVADSAYGRAFSVVGASVLDDFFATVDVAQFGQLRVSPVREAYGEEIMVLGTVLDLLGDEGKATEFGFVTSQTHYGYLFERLRLPRR